MLADAIESYAFGSVLDMGTGTGILAERASDSSKVTNVIGVDVNPAAIEYCLKNIRNKKIKFFHSNLFKNIKGKFDFIVFNPPYLPHGKDGIKDKALIGGKKGSEVIEQFFKDVSKHLSSKGRVLMVFSSLTDKEKVDTVIRKHKFKINLLEKKHISFEDLYLYMLEK
jgi:release factor glutamine methyltransferase